jgi:hypothetical protein
VDEPEQTVRPPVSSRDPPPTPAHPGPSDEGEEETAADRRTSPFPCAENFDERVADETAASDGRPHRDDRDSRDAAP